jgi:sulfite exporter TauE/SafE
MWTLLSAVLAASLLGSAHCVGMCGPFAMMASRDRTWVTLPMYHAGRLLTYTLLGALAGVLGARIDVLGSWLGWTSMAARLAGASLVAWAIYRLLQFWRPSRWPTVGLPIAQTLTRLRPKLAGLAPAPRAMAIGGLTTLLPCGWLYIYVIVAAGAASAAAGSMVMLAFWLGTLPALSALAIGWQRLAARHGGQRWLPLALSIMLLVSGMLTLWRGDAAVTAWADRFSQSVQSADPLERLERSATDLPPCCEPD